MIDKNDLVVGDIFIRIKGFKNLVGERYRVLSITLTDVYIQNLNTNRCQNYPIRFLKYNYIKE